MRIGYARASPLDADNLAQWAALDEAKCQHIFEEHGSVGRWHRPELNRLLAQLGENDTLVVWKLDCLSTSLKDILVLLEKVGRIGAGFISLAESFDSTSPGGSMMMRIIKSFGDFERAMLRERTLNGLSAARAEGRIGGRRPKLSAPQQEEIVRLVASGEKTAAESARLFHIHPSTVARLLLRTRSEI